MQAIRLSWQPWEGFFNAFCLLLACHSPASVKPVLSHPNSSSRCRSFRALQLSEGGWLFLLNCSSLPFFPLFFFFFPSRSCCQRCFSGKFPAGLHDGLGRVLQTAGCLLRADTRAGSGPQPGLYSCSLNPAAAPLGELGGCWVPVAKQGGILWPRNLKIARCYRLLPSCYLNTRV